MIVEKRVFDPERIKLGRQLRQDTSEPMRLRRAGVGFAFGATATLGILALFQTGIVKHLPDPPLRRFKAEAVSSTGEGYVMGIPDALLGMVSFTATASLIAAGPPDRAERQPWWPILALVKSGVDSLYALRLAKIQVRDLRLYCAYCLTTTALTMGMHLTTWREGWMAFRHLEGPRQDAEQQMAA